MDSILKSNIKSVQKLNAKASKGSLKSFEIQLEIGKLCAEGYAYWKANKKELNLNREDLLNAYGYKKSFFGELKKSAEVSDEVVSEYIASIDTPTYSIRGLLKFASPENDKPKTWYTFSTAKEIGGGSLRIDENLDVSMNGTKAEIIENLKYVLYKLQMTEETEKATIELVEVVEA